jgi:hypothetical protein
MYNRPPSYRHGSFSSGRSGSGDEFYDPYRRHDHNHHDGKNDIVAKKDGTLFTFRDRAGKKLGKLVIKE